MTPEETRELKAIAGSLKEIRDDLLHRMEQTPQVRDLVGRTTDRLYAIERLAGLRKAEWE